MERTVWRVIIFMETDGLEIILGFHGENEIIRQLSY